MSCPRSPWLSVRRRLLGRCEHGASPPERSLPDPGVSMPSSAPAAASSVPRTPADAARAALSDPATQPHRLATIAGLHAGLRADVAAQANTYPELLEWFARYGDGNARRVALSRLAVTPRPPAITNHPGRVRRLRAVSRGYLGRRQRGPSGVGLRCRLRRARRGFPDRYRPSDRRLSAPPHGLRVFEIVYQPGLCTVIYLIGLVALLGYQPLSTESTVRRSASGSCISK